MLPSRCLIFKVPEFAAHCVLQIPRRYRAFSSRSEISTPTYFERGKVNPSVLASPIRLPCRGAKKQANEVRPYGRNNKFCEDFMPLTRQRCVESPHPTSCVSINLYRLHGRRYPPLLTLSEAKQTLQGSLNKITQQQPQQFSCRGCFLYIIIVLFMPSLRKHR